MGLSRALATGASSLRAHQARFDVIADNIANVNTIGFKSNSMTFADELYQNYGYSKAPDIIEGVGIGGQNANQIGLGVKIGAISMDMGQGMLELTNRPLDLAFQGDGFFVYNLGGKQLYSRAGAITQDKDGNFVDSASGALLQGYNVTTDANGKLIKDATGTDILSKIMGNLQVKSNMVSPPNQTKNVVLTGNLNADMALNDTRQTSISIYDNRGGVHSLVVTFTKTANPNEFSVAATVDDKAVALDTSTLTFNADGTINTPKTFSMTAADINTALGTNVFDATTPQNITLNLASGTSAVTQYSGTSTTTTESQDGCASGDLQNMSVDNAGKVWGLFTNGRTELVGQLVMAKFVNQAGLQKEGGNFFSQTSNSGNASIGTAVETFPTTQINSGVLEQSNVDLTSQFTDMISTQRGFEAAARVITVSDQMLAELSQLKR
ncbi:MAG: flagellar hook protein FlgE [FCB group bacterium]|jgi:flagellar hook protein FlgE